MSSASSLLLPRSADPRLEEFRFVEESHTYFLGARKLPGITGILKAVGYVDTTYYTEEARNRGSHVHLAIKFLNKQTLDWSTVIDAYIGYVTAYEKLVKDWNIKLDFFEEPLYHPDLFFAGTPDIVCKVLDGIPAIIELKTGPVPKWGALQTAAQALLVRAWEPKPIMRRRWGVTLNADGTYSKPKEFKEWERDEVVFRMLNSAVQVLGAKTEPIFALLNSLTPEEMTAINAIHPTLKSVIEHRELYAA